MSSRKYQGGNHIPKVQISGQAGGLERYIRAVERAGAIPVPGICPSPDPSCEALVLCGGGDMDPVLFGQENRGSNPPDRERDRAELALVEAFLTWKRPVLGICRGMQVLNVFLGGTLIQDLQPAWRALHQGRCLPPDPLSAGKPAGAASGALSHGQQCASSGGRPSGT